ncbi:MAG: hypothetical protein ACO3C1_08465 [Ilumatobacteraceae bacterium]
MSARHARVRLRYRPASDVLSGEIELGTLAADDRVVESTDSDVHLEWRPGLAADGLLLSAFQLVHASALIDSAAAQRLPRHVVELSRQLIRSGAGALRPGASAIEQVQARADAEAHLTVQQLLRPADQPDPRTPPTATPADADQARRVAAAIEHLVSTIERLPGADDDLHRTVEFVRLARELAAVLRDRPGATAPGTAAAARRAARGGLPLCATERSRLRWALEAVDDASAWPRAVDALTALTADLDRDGRLAR